MNIIQIYEFSFLQIVTNTPKWNLPINMLNFKNNITKTFKKSKCIIYLRKYKEKSVNSKMLCNVEGIGVGKTIDFYDAKKMYNCKIEFSWVSRKEGLRK
jgi:hypothetical protein